MGHKKAAVSAVLAVGFFGLIAAPTWGQMKGSDPGSAPRSSSQKDDATSPGSSSSGMKSGESGKRSGAASDPMGDRSSASGTRQSASAGSWNSEEIKKVQEALKDKGNDPGPVDGIMGPQTQKALRAFQSAQGLKTTGRLDAQTAKALGVEHGSSSSSSSSSGSSMPDSDSSSSKRPSSGMSKDKAPASR